MKTLKIYKQLQKETSNLHVAGFFNYNSEDPDYNGLNRYDQLIIAIDEIPSSIDLTEVEIKKYTYANGRDCYHIFCGEYMLQEGFARNKNNPYVSGTEYIPENVVKYIKMKDFDAITKDGYHHFFRAYDLVSARHRATFLFTDIAEVNED